MFNGAIRTIAFNRSRSRAETAYKGELHDRDDQEGDSEDNAVIAERLRNGKRSNERRRHRDHHRPQTRASSGSATLVNQA
jgi:hypothetical protein